MALGVGVNKPTNALLTQMVFFRLFFSMSFCVWCCTGGVERAGAI